MTFELSDHDRAVYSPEDSDDHPWGDWQTKLTAALIVVLFCIAGVAAALALGVTCHGA